MNTEEYKLEDDVYVYECVSTGFWTKEQFTNWVSKLKTENFAHGARLYKQLMEHNPKFWRD